MKFKNVFDCLARNSKEELPKEVAFSEMLKGEQGEVNEVCNQVWGRYTSGMGNVDSVISEALGDISEFEAERIYNTGTLEEKQAILDDLFGRIDEALTLINGAIAVINRDYGLHLFIRFQGIAKDSKGLYSDIKRFQITEEYYDLDREWREYYFRVKKPNSGLERAVYAPYDSLGNLVPRSVVPYAVGGDFPQSHTFNFAAGGLFESTKRNAGILNSDWVSFEKDRTQRVDCLEAFYDPKILELLQFALHARLRSLTMLYRRVAAAKTAINPEVKTAKFQARLKQPLTFIKMSPVESLERVQVLGDLSSTSTEARDALFAVLGPKILGGEGTGEEAIALIADLYGKKVEITQAKGAEQIVVETSDAADERTLDPEIQTALLLKLKGRFEANMSRHEGIQWVGVQSSLEADPEKLWSLQQMETAGHAPDVYMEDDGAYYFGTCSEETPAGEGQRNIVYDAEAQALFREGTMCNGNAVDVAAAMGIELMDEAQYRHLQTLGKFDAETWSWLKTFEAMRKSGYALFGSRADERVRVYQGVAYSRNPDGAFRGSLRVSKA